MSDTSSSLRRSASVDELAALLETDPKEIYGSVTDDESILEWTAAEEDVVRKKLDYRVMIWACVMFFSLQLVRNNIQNAISADFLVDAGISQNTYNLGQTLFLIFFLLCEIPSQSGVRVFGAHIWLPSLTVLWAVISILQIFIHEEHFFLFTRAAIGACQGGFIPGLTFYLSSFYKGNELSMRYSWIWATQSGSNVIGALLASVFIQIGGRLRGWQYVFLLEGIISALIGIASFFVMPSLRDEVVSSVFTEREHLILRVRVSLDDPSKHKQQDKVQVTSSSVASSLRAVLEAATDRYLLPIYFLGLVAFVPAQTANYYLTITLRQLGFSQIVTNLLTIPYAVVNIIMTVGVSKLSDRYDVRWVFCLLAAIWVFPNQLLLEIMPESASRWARYAVVTLLLGYPYYHPVLISWISANSNNSSRRSLSFAIYNISVQLGNVIASNVYREDDGPYYRRGNGVLLGLNVLSMVIILAIRQYFMAENRRRARIWDALEGEKARSEADDALPGNQKLSFRLKI